jgi:HAD superfamily phosphatase (TIGR01681 family)
MTKPSLVIFDLDETLMCNEGRMYTYVEEMLKEIKANNMKIALASYNINGERQLKASGIIDYFDVIICEDWTEETLDYKQRMLKEVLEVTNMTPADAIFFDDNMRNIETAEEMGIKSIHLEAGEIYEKFKMTREWSREIVENV